MSRTNGFVPASIGEHQTAVEHGVRWITTPKEVAEVEAEEKAYAACVKAAAVKHSEADAEALAYEAREARFKRDKQAATERVASGESPSVIKKLFGPGGLGGSFPTDLQRSMAHDVVVIKQSEAELADLEVAESAERLAVLKVKLDTVIRARARVLCSATIRELAPMFALAGVHGGLTGASGMELPEPRSDKRAHKTGGK